MYIICVSKHFLKFCILEAYRFLLLTCNIQSLYGSDNIFCVDVLITFFWSGRMLCMLVLFPQRRPLKKSNISGDRQSGNIWDQLWLYILFCIYRLSFRGNFFSMIFPAVLSVCRLKPREAFILSTFRYFIFTQLTCSINKSSNR